MANQWIFSLVTLVYSSTFWLDIHMINYSNSNWLLTNLTNCKKQTLSKRFYLIRGIIVIAHGIEARDKILTNSRLKSYFKKSIKKSIKKIELKSFARKKVINAQALYPDLWSFNGKPIRYESETTKYNSLFQLFLKISEIIQFQQTYLLRETYQQTYQWVPSRMLDSIIITLSHPTIT